MQHVFLALPSSAGLQVFFTFRTNREVAIGESNLLLHKIE